MYSVIIPAKNEAANISRCIKSIFQCIDNPLKVEIIVVDNGSYDNTVNIARKAGATVLVKPEGTIAALRNHGASKSKHDIIAFIDADCEATYGWLENGRRILKDRSIGIVGDYYLLPDNPSWVEKAFWGGIPRTRREVFYLSGGNMIMRKEVFSLVSGFDEASITGEDYILCQKVRSAGFNIIADPSVGVIHHGNARTIVGLFRREVWCGLGMVMLWKHGKLTLPLIWAAINTLLLSGIVIALFFKWSGIGIAFFAIFLLLPLTAALVQCRRNGIYHSMLHRYIVLAIYGVARMVSLLCVLGNALIPRHRLRGKRRSENAN